MPDRCPECGAPQLEDRTCQEDFHTLLGWETEYAGYGDVHHLTVLSYHLQHPSLYSAEGLTFAKGLLVDFLEKGKSPQDVRRESKGKVNSGKRSWKIRGKPGSHGSYDHPVEWTMTAADVARAEHFRFIESVRTWAESILRALRGSNNL